MTIPKPGCIFDNRAIRKKSDRTDARAAAHDSGSLRRSDACNEMKWRPVRRRGYSRYAVRNPPQCLPRTRTGTSISRIITVLPLPMSRA
jgi:hypothetical protein